MSLVSSQFICSHERLPVENSCYVKYDKFESLVDLVAQNPSVIHQVDQNKQTLLHHAASTGNLKMVKFLVAKDAQFNEVDNCGNLPLHLAIMGGHKCTAKFLLNIGSDARLPNKDGLQPIHLAAERNDKDTLKILLKISEIDVNAEGERGASPLHYCCQRDSVDCLQLLVNNHANLNIRNVHLSKISRQETEKERSQVHLPTVISSTGSDDSTVTGDLNTRCGRGRGVQMQKVWSAIPRSLTMFSDDCALSAHTYDGLLCLAENFPAAVRHFGLTINAKKALVRYEPAPEESLTLIRSSRLERSFAPQHENLPSRKHIIHRFDRRPRILVVAGHEDHPTNNGNYDHIQVATLENGADIYSRDLECTYPIHVAIANISPNCVRALFAHEESFHAARLEQRETKIPVTTSTPTVSRISLEVEKFRGSSGTVSIGKGANSFDRKRRKSTTEKKLLHLAQILRRYSRQKLETEQCMIDLVDCEGETPLHTAVTSGDTEMVKICLKKQAWILATQNDESTPVHYACIKDDLECVDLMLNARPEEKEAVLRMPNKNGYTPLHLAAVYNHEQLVQYLVEKVGGIRESLLVSMHLRTDNLLY
ncbi:transient receptor potential cation channel subfamily A member 1 [Clonorchis sinensis]|uniref:Transient receptor potential cation channel subfamily A member 1 n=1 Tax=Clonorchis sinensis TaxID=79923 RepID=G7YTF0_CLOSI|nr:transient receptor potential cation channel subfamily A member 1 [Clonorchis sinensis]